MPSAELAKIIGAGDTTPAAAVERVWEYVRRQRLKEPDAEAFRVDELLNGVFGPGPTITFREAARRMGQHLGLSEPEPALVKLALQDDGGAVETPWAEHLGGHLYRLHNIPFFAYRFSEGDVVEAEPQAEGFPLVKRAVQKSGNRTVRIHFERGATALPGQRLLAQLEVLGCSWEGAKSKLICLTVPPSVSLEQVAGFLVTARVQWEYADPPYEDLFPAG